MTKGFFAVGIWHPKHGANVGSLFRSALLYGASMVFTVGRRYERQASDTPKTWTKIPLMHFSDIDDLRAHLPYSCPLVGIELHETAVPLAKFHHPARATYLLGAEDHGLPDEVVGQCHKLVQIEAPEKWSMNVSNAGSVLLYDRYRKNV